MFRGRFVHTIDSKNRVSLPGVFRTELQRRGDHPPIITNAHQCLELHPFEDWKVFEERIVGMATLDPEAQAYSRMMVSGALEAPVDGQGRILIPQHLREYAGIGRTVTVAGVGTKIELWNTERFEANLIQTQARFEEMAMSLAAKLGS
jgi:MraZ protein